MEKKVIKLNPYIAEYIWGGTALKDSWNKSTDAKKVAEAWELSAFIGKESVVNGGVYDGYTLPELIVEAPDFFGTKLHNYELFPLLIKLINAKQALSIQVHPNDEYALAVEGQLGKTEVWYVAEADENAFIYLGFNRKMSREKIIEKIESGTLLEVLNKMKVKVGDFIEIPPGTVHAVQGGLTILEVQENSNVTYRIFDYDRVEDSGKKRELHVEKAIEILSTEKYVKTKNKHEKLENKLGQDLICLTKNKYFCVYKGSLPKASDLFSVGSFISITAIYGNGYFSTGEEIKKGDTYLVPANTKITIMNKSKELGIICVTLGET